MVAYGKESGPGALAGHAGEEEKERGSKNSSKEVKFAHADDVEQVQVGRRSVTQLHSWWSLGAAQNGCLFFSPTIIRRDPAHQLWDDALSTCMRLLDAYACQHLFRHAKNAFCHQRPGTF